MAGERAPGRLHGVRRRPAGIRYGQAAPLRFPFWISGLPAAWHISEVDYGQHVTVDGVAAILDYSPKASEYQSVCVPDWHGLRVEVVLTFRQAGPAPAPTGPHGVPGPPETMGGWR